ncbi:Ribosomal protein S18 acetylase RimI-like enzyme [Paraburkholderia tropica]|uniref:GNAT family N-acetyltransferase n=1 Tax=Paraburkholderia tropica TaxID=92647 RepID=UPI001CAC9B84|nr:GNAT family N-acetyltransferase [Paraburkholderia tropica]CAG9226884.1 Ribosomal protein S18 acetylase RimI-like enzyme [Paraburkholderia tropica]
MNWQTAPHETRISDAIPFELIPIAEGQTDRQALFALYQSSLHDYIDQTFGWDDAFQQARFNTSYRDADFEWIAQGKEIAGYLALSHEAQAVHVSLLIVKPEFRNRGIGRAVMRTIMSRASQSNRSITLSCFLCNHDAVRFYESLGFQIEAKDEHFVTYRFPADGSGAPPLA